MRVKDNGFLKMVQRRATRVAITASPTRGQGAKGVVACARDFLGGLNLSPFGTGDPRAFARRLESASRRLEASMPRRAASWGLARKLLNIFLRNCLYTTYLARHYRLTAAERLLEIPLDSITAKRIRIEVPDLPRWPGVKHLNPETSTAFQAAALLIARQYGVARVHLDAYWWGARE